MNLLFLEQHPRFSGGSERVTFSLCQHAVGRGHRAWLVYEQDGDMVAAYRALGAICEQAPIAPIAVREPGAAWRSLRHLRRVTRSNDVDLIFTSQVNYASVVATIGRWQSVPTVVHLGLVYDYPSPVFQTSIQHVSLGVAPSSHTADGWRRHGWPSETLVVIPNGIDTARFSAGAGRGSARQRLGLCEASSPLVAYVGRITRSKGVFTLVAAFERYRQSGGRGRLLCVGATPRDESDELRAHARAVGLPDAAWDLRPAMSTPEDVYRAADVVVVPSEWDEPFGLVPLEAMSSGTLALVSDRGIMPTFVSAASGDAVFAAGDAAQLSDRLHFWLSDAARLEQAATRAATHVRDTYGLDACGDRYLREFSRLVTH